MYVHLIFFVLVCGVELATANELSNESSSAVSTLQEGCGSIKGCFVSPPGCNGSSCDFIVTYRARGEYTDFEVYSDIGPYNDGAYISIGFNTEPQMGGASVVDCIKYDGEYNVQVSYNQGKSNVIVDVGPDTLDEYKFTYDSGALVCSFSRLSEIISENSMNVDLLNLTTGNEYYLLVAKGKASSTTKKEYHGYLDKVISGETIDFNAIRVSSRADSSGMSPMVKAHGAIMIISWMLMVGFGLLNARYYKNEWKDQSKYGLQFWFLFHRTSMQIGVLGLIAGFILIFVQVDGWSQFGESTNLIVSLHPYIGVVATALAVLNPVMAVFRPGLLADGRVIFNWAHRITGQLAFILAIFNIFLGLFLPGVEEMLPRWLLYVMIVYAVLHVATEIALSFLTRNEKKTNALDIQNNSSTHQVSSEIKLSIERCSDQEKLSKSIMKCTPKVWLLRLYTVSTLILVVILVSIIIWPPSRFEPCSTDGLTGYFDDEHPQIKR